MPRFFASSFLLYPVRVRLLGSCAGAARGRGQSAAALVKDSGYCRAPRRSVTAANGDGTRPKERAIKVPARALKSSAGPTPSRGGAAASMPPPLPITSARFPATVERQPPRQEMRTRDAGLPLNNTPNGSAPPKPDERTRVLPQRTAPSNLRRAI